MSAPAFAVVGRVNKGKSSIIATLAEDDRIAIAPVPGTTRTTTEFPVRVDDRVLFTLIDTPGFEEAPRALAHLKQVDLPDHARADRVAAFVRQFQDTDEFVEECRLLRPILDGAGILYVVDGTKPYRSNYQAEMEILRWTGRPRMALINRIGDGDYSDQWRRALDQYFSVVREFDAQDATFTERIRLLKTFRELDERWRNALDEAIDALAGERQRRREEVAYIITELLIAELTYTLETRTADGMPRADERVRLETEFHDALRQKEHQARAQVERLYKHRVPWEMGDLSPPAFDQDLFARNTWDLLGLSPKQALALYTMSGATVGGMIDASVGGASFLAGTGIGALIGAGAGVYHLQKRFARAASVDELQRSLRNVLNRGTGLRVGPHAHPNFPFVLLDRALLHYDGVRERAHARQDQPVVAEHSELSQNLDRSRRDSLHALFTKIRKSYRDVPRELHQALYEHVVVLVANMGP